MRHDKLRRCESDEERETVRVLGSFVPAVALDIIMNRLEVMGRPITNTDVSIGSDMITEGWKFSERERGSRTIGSLCGGAPIDSHVDRHHRLHLFS